MQHTHATAPGAVVSVLAPAPSRSLSPLTVGVEIRLAAVGLAAACLWLAVWWAA